MLISWADPQRDQAFLEPLVHNRNSLQMWWLCLFNFQIKWDLKFWASLSSFSTKTCNDQIVSHTSGGHASMTSTKCSLRSWMMTSIRTQALPQAATSTPVCIMITLVWIWYKQRTTALCPNYIQVQKPLSQEWEVASLFIVLFLAVLEDSCEF